MEVTLTKNLHDTRSYWTFAPAKDISANVSGLIAIKDEYGQYMTTTHSNGLIFQSPKVKDYAAFQVHSTGNGCLMLEGAQISSFLQI